MPARAAYSSVRTDQPDAHALCIWLDSDGWPARAACRVKAPGPPAGTSLGVLVCGAPRDVLADRAGASPEAQDAGRTRGGRRGDVRAAEAARSGDGDRGHRFSGGRGLPAARTVRMRRQPGRAAPRSARARRTVGRWGGGVRARRGRRRAGRGVRRDRRGCRRRRRAGQGQAGAGSGHRAVGRGPGRRVVRSVSGGRWPLPGSPPAPRQPPPRRAARGGSGHPQQFSHQARAQPVVGRLLPEVSVGTPGGPREGGDGGVDRGGREHGPQGRLGRRPGCRGEQRLQPCDRRADRACRAGRGRRPGAGRWSPYGRGRTRRPGRRNGTGTSVTTWNHRRARRPARGGGRGPQRLPGRQGQGVGTGPHQQAHRTPRRRRGSAVGGQREGTVSAVSEPSPFSRSSRAYSKRPPERAPGRTAACLPAGAPGVGPLR